MSETEEPAQVFEYVCHRVERIYQPAWGTRRLLPCVVHQTSTGNTNVITCTPNYNHLFQLIKERNPQFFVQTLHRITVLIFLYKQVNHTDQ